MVSMWKEKNTMGRTFEIDINNKFMDIIKADNTKQAEEMAKKMYPNKANSIQVWEIGANGKEND